MRTIVAGGRNGVSISDVEAALNTAPFIVSTVLCGMARGADLCGKYVAQKRGIPVEEYPADWSKYGKSAGLKRNAEMATKAEALIAVWDGVSRGTKHMIGLAEANGLLVHIYRVG